MKKRLRKRNGKHGSAAKRELGLESLEDRMLLANPRLVAILPNSGDILQPGRILNTAPNELLFRFDVNQSIDPGTLDGIEITRSGGDDAFQSGPNSNDVPIVPGYVGIGEEANEVIIRFRETLPDDLYEIHIIGFGDDALRNTDGDAFDNDPETDGLQDLFFRFRLDLGAQVTAVVPQPVTRGGDGALAQARNQITVYFNDDDLNPTLARNPDFYQLIETNETATNQDDPDPFKPVSIAYNANSDTAVLTFARDLAQLGTGTGTFRLRIGDSESIPTTPFRRVISDDPGSSFDTAASQGVLSNRALILESKIDPQPWLVTFPGSNEDPGSRDIPYDGEQHVELSPDPTDGIRTIAYNFKNELGADENGNPFFNFITEEQKQRAREAFELWTVDSGIEFIESETSGITVGFGDLRAIDPLQVGGRDDGILFRVRTDPTFEEAMVVLDVAEQWDDSFGDNTNSLGQSWFRYVMAGIGRTIGLGNASNLPAPSIMYTSPPAPLTDTPLPEITFPGSHDIAHLQHIHRPDSIDIDLYQFEITEPGVFTAEISAQRLTDASLLDSALVLYRENLDGTRTLAARNDDYFSEDSFIQIDVEPGNYFIGVSSTGNTEYNPNFEDSGAGGTTQGEYELRLNFSPIIDNVLRDSTGTAFDGDADGQPNGVYNFWFRTATSTNRTLFVDKASASTLPPDGSLSNPYIDISSAFQAAQPGDIVRVVGNAGDDGDLDTLADNEPYVVGFDALGQRLPDGDALKVPRGVTLIIDAGVVIKLNESAIQVGSSSPEVDRSRSAIQVLGTPDHSVHFTSFNDSAVGAETEGFLTSTLGPGDWGGIRIQNDVDREMNRFEYERAGVFLNYIAHADMRYGGGSVFVDSVRQIVTPIDLQDARPTIVFNSITRSADAAISANPDSFEETNLNGPEFQQAVFTSDYSRVGPDIYGNTLRQNTTNGLFVRIRTPAGAELQEMLVSGRWDDTDIVHVISENLIIGGNPGGPLGDQISGNRNIPVEERFELTARLDASLVIDPGIVVKLDGARIETGLGAQLTAEGTANRPIIFTSHSDDRFGAGGTFDLRSDQAQSRARPGDYAGLYFGHASNGSLDYTYVAHGGGVTSIEGSFTAFNAVEIHQADVRITNSTFDDNFNGTGGQASANRFGRGDNAPGAIYVLGAQPIIVNNLFRDTVGSFGASFAPAINIDVNSLNHELVRDWGRTIGQVDRITEYRDNYGPLVRENLFVDNSTNGMIVRGGTLTTQSIWDDTDIVHVVLDEIIVSNFDTYGGLRLESSPTESLVVKFSGTTAGLTATGKPLDITDRIGGALHIVGHPSNPVILTSLRDDTQGAGFLNDTNNDSESSQPQPGDWRGILIDRYAHDRNVAVYSERELPTAVSPGSNDNPSTAEVVGNLAPAENAGDDNRRLGFEIHGVLNQPTDQDVYSFLADGGTQVWIDIDRTSDQLDSIVELVSITGQVLARSDNSAAETLTQLGPESERLGALSGLAQVLNVANERAGDLYSTNAFDAGMRVQLPGPAGVTGLYHVRVRSSSDNLDNLRGGHSSGVYDLSIRLRETDEVPGNVVTYADIKYATNGIEVLGQPGHSPLLGEQTEVAGINDTLATAQDLGSLLANDLGAISLAGVMDSATDVDWYQIEVRYNETKVFNPQESVSVIFDIDYADGLGRPDTVLSVFNTLGELVLIGNNSGLVDDVPKPNAGSDITDTSRGSVGSLDPHIGPVQLLPGTYYVAVSSGTIPTVVNQYTTIDATDTLARLEPLDSVKRIGEDHIFIQNVSTAEEPQIPIIFGEEFALFVPDDVSINEGETITIESQAGQKVTFEFDSEGFLLLPPDPSELVDGETIAIRSSLGELATFRLSREGFAVDFTDSTRIFDGDQIEIFDAFGGRVLVEFDDNFITSSGTIPVVFNEGQSTEQIAEAFANALNARTMLDAILAGDANGTLDVVELPNATGLFAATMAGWDIITPSAGDALTVPFSENQTQLEFVQNLVSAINRSPIQSPFGLPTATIEGLHTFKIRLNGVSDVRLSRGGGMATNQPVRAGNYIIPYTADDTALIIETAIQTAINDAMGSFGITAGFGFVGGGLGVTGGISLVDNSLNRGTFGGGTTLFNPPVPVVGLSPDSSLSILKPGPVPFTLQDVTLFVVSEGISFDGEDSSLWTVDAYSGASETFVGPFDPPVGDVAMRPAGRGSLYALSNFEPNNRFQDVDDSTTGNLFEISTTNGDATLVGDDDVMTYIADLMGMAPFPATVTNDGAGAGINYEAMTFINNNFLVAVGSRWDAFFRDPTPQELADFPFTLLGNDYRTNIVYLIDARDGAADSIGPQRNTPQNPVPEYVGAGTQIVELGHIDTVNDLTGTTGTILSTVEATTVVGQSWTANITDGMTITLNDGVQRHTLEFDSGPEITLTTSPNTGQTIRDGEFFFVDGQRYTFDTGVVLVVEGNGERFVDGETITTVDTLGTRKVYEFDSNNNVLDGQIAIPFARSFNQGQMINTIVNAINQTSDSLVAASSLGNRITLVNDSSVTENATGVEDFGNTGVSTGVALRVEETFSRDQIAQVIVDTFRSVPQITASHAGDRVNFLGAATADFEDSETLVDSGNLAGASRPGYIPIGFLAGDSAEIIAARIVNAINLQTAAAASQFTDNTVSLITAGATMPSTTAPFVIGGAPVGGTITGIVEMPDPDQLLTDDLYLAVSDTGGLYEFNADTRTSRYITTSTDLLGIQFSGLSLGPPDIENGRYAETLFGIDELGTMYSFDARGQFVPVFANGQSQVDTGVSQPVGLAFGLLQENLWTRTGLRFDDPGHGYEIPVTSSRLRQGDGGSSFHFGVSVDDLNNRNYDYPGGAQGTMVSNTFSLADYTSADQPMLYFSYFLDTEDVDYSPTAPRPMRDSFRVYIMDDRENGDNGEWHLLATNNQYISNVNYDEFDDMDIADGIHYDTQVLFDNVGWRQARIPLEEFAGRENLRLRFEFSSAGGVSLGNDAFFTGAGSVITTGAFFNQLEGFGGQEGTELYAIPAHELRDGHEFTLGGYGGFFGGGGGFFSTTFEFDLGYTLVPPSGDQIADGEVFTLITNSGAAVRYEFDKDGEVGDDDHVPVIVRDTMSAADVTTAIDRAVVGSDLGQPSSDGNQFVGTLATEGNDNLRLAVDSGLRTDATGTFTAAGTIGDNPDVTALADVDFVKFNLNLGDTVQVALDAASSNLALRLFNEEGVEVQPVPQGIPFIDFTAFESGTYYAGVSHSSNIFYDPLDGTSFLGPGLGTPTNYEIQVTTGGSRITAFPHGNRLNVHGVAGILQSPGAALFVDGEPGTLNPSSVPIAITGNMNEIEVAAAIEEALGNAYSGGQADWVLRRDEMIKIAGRTVEDPGPLGMSDHLWGDFTSAFNFSWDNDAYPDGPLRGLDNAHEGVYIDDVIIGFAERGEFVVDAAADTTFIDRVDITDRSILTGPYQLEIREASQYGRPSILAPLLDLAFIFDEDGRAIQQGRTFDTNERLTNAITLDTSDGSNLATGQAFSISDDLGFVNFEYVDASVSEGNDTLATALDSGLLGGLSATYIGIGQIGDNRAFEGDNSSFGNGLDVDIIELNLQEDDLVVVDVDSFNPDSLVITPSTLDSAIRVFDQTGRQIAISDNDRGPGDLDVRSAFLDPAVTFRATTTGRYYVAISQAQNVTYQPTVAGSGTPPTHFNTFRTPSIRNDIDIFEDEFVELTGGTYEVRIDLNDGEPAGDIIKIPFASFDDKDDVANRIVRAINSDEAQARVGFAAAPRQKTGTIDLFGDNIIVVNETTSLSPESNDTIDTATSANTEFGIASRFVVNGRIGDNSALANPDLDVDMFEVKLEAGAILTVDVDAFETGSRLLAAVTIVDSLGNPLVTKSSDQIAVDDILTYNAVNPLTPLNRRITEIDPLLKFRAATTDTYYVAISSNANVAGSPLAGFLPTFDPLVVESGDLQSPFFLQGVYTAVIQIGDGSIESSKIDLYGDSNIRRTQGQLILESNRILYSDQYGISVGAGARDAVGTPHPGPVRNLPDIPVSGLVPGVTIKNNVIARSDVGGIRFSGDAGGAQLGAVPFGRIVNNTIYGKEVVDLANPLRNTVGIQVENNASPTILNNIVAEFGNGITIDTTSTSTVVGGSLYHNNDFGAALGDFAISVSSFQSLFADALDNNFYLVAGAAAIDSSIDSLRDRVDLINIRDTLGIPVSPILAPDLDNAGQLRVDDPDVDTPVGLGANVFKDRGALDRADVSGPRAIVVNPLDNDPAGEDGDDAEGVVLVPSASLRNFVIDLIDNNGNGGVGVDDQTVSAATVQVSRDGVPLTEGEDYIFEYSTTNNQIRLSPVSGIWPRNSSFEIRLTNSIRDLAGNRLRPNRLDGQTLFVVSTDLGRDYGDAPFGSLLDDDGARHQIVSGFFLGKNISNEPDALLNNDASGDEFDDGVEFGTSFVPGLTTDVIISASAPGFVDAWVDWNGDGVWDSGEQAIVSREVATGPNRIVLTAPSDATPKTTFARIRFSSEGGLEPTGLADDGEVEDYQVTIGTNPWQNLDNMLDVDGTGGVANPLDALLVINEISDFVYASATDGRLPIPAGPDAPPPFLDVNGDGFVSPIDALLVINSLPSSAPLRAPLTNSAVPAIPPIVVSPLMSVDVQRITNPMNAFWRSHDSNNISSPEEIERFVDEVHNPRTWHAARDHLRRLGPPTPRQNWSDIVDLVFDSEVDPSIVDDDFAE